MGRRLLILFLMLATAITTSAIAVGVSQDLVTNCDEGHTWEDSSVLVEADCTTAGVLLQLCAVCGEKQEVAIDALGHDLKLLPGSEKAPTCTDKGAEATTECVREGCDYEIAGDAIDASGHEYGEFTSNGNGTHSKVCANDDDHVVTEDCSGGEATCTEKATCSVCGEKYGSELLHNYNVEKATAEYLKEEATCVTKAQYYYSCECGAQGARWFEYGEYAPHVYENEIVETEFLKSPADCSHDAVYYLSCDCTAYGDDAYTFVAVGTMGEHSYQNTTVKDATTLVSEATCTAHAVYKYTCTGCDAIGTETYEGEILDHDVTYHAAVEATCTVEGFVEYWSCATCSKNYDAEQGGTEIENLSLGLNANNHKNVVVSKEAQEPTCTVAGWTKEETCNDCGVVVTESEDLEKVAHVGSTTEVNSCANCDHVFTVAEIVEMAQALASGKSLTGKYELTGVISKITYAAGASNISVDMVVENGDNDLTINCYKLNGNGFSVLAVGDTITVQGLIKNYSGTIEFDGTTATNCVLISSLHSVTVEETENGSVSVNVNEQVAIGTEVIVTVTPDAGYKVIGVTVNGSTLVAVEGVYKFNVEKATVVKAVFVEEGSSEVLPSTATLTFDANKDNRKEYSTTKQVWSQDDVTLTNNKAGSTNNVGDYTNPGRFYKSSEVIISFTQKMVKIVIDATGIESKYVTPYADSITNYTVTIEGGFVTIDLGEGVESITFTTSAQLRAKAITVYYFEESQEEACAHEDTEITKAAKDATCTEAGWTDEITCISCGVVVDESEPIDALGHDMTYHAAVEATCQANGNVEYWACANCSKNFDAEEDGEEIANVTVVDEDNHTGLVTLEAVEATCTTTGLTEGEYCEDCGVTTLEQETVGTLPHNMTYHASVEATCQANGNVEYWACSVCEKNYNAEQNGEVIENVTVVDKDNHTDLITLEATAATCTETGLTEGQKCNACGVTTIAQDIVPALNHLDEEADNICDRTGCGAIMCDGSHLWEDKKDADKHWEECSACHEIQNVATHTYENPEYRVVDGALKLVSTCVCGAEKVEDVVEEVVEVSNAKDIATVLSAGVDVVLTEDVTLTEGSLEITKSVNVDLNGNDILVNGVKGDVCEAFYVRGAGVEVTITNAGDVIANTDSEEAEHIIAVSATEGAIVNIQGGNFVSYGSSTIFATTGAVINIYGGRFEAKELYGGVNYLIDIDETIARENWGKINVYGGEFVGFNPANHTNDGAEYTNKVAEGYHSILVGDAYVVSAHNHSSEETAPTCTTAGFTTYTCVCGDTYEVAGEDALGHEYGELVEKVDATCSATGMEAHYFCDVCDTYFDAEKNATTEVALTIAIDADNHSGLVTLEAVEATCTSTGLTEGEYCEDCETTITAQETVGALGHNMTYHAAVEATCATAGNVEYWACANCSKNFDAEEDGEEIANVTIAAPGHNYVNGECSVCHAIKQNKDVATFEFGANGTTTEGTNAVSATYNVETVNGYNLTLTNTSKVYNKSGDAKGNSALKLGSSSAVGSFSFTVPSDVTSVSISVGQRSGKAITIAINGKNYSISKNSANGEYDEIIVDTTATKTINFTTVKTGNEYRCLINTIVFYAQTECDHAGTLSENVEAPNCTEDGYTQYTCSKCAHTWKVAGEEALGHEYGELVEKVDATCSATGMEAHYLCDVCDTYFDAEKNATTEDALTIAINAESHSGLVTLEAVEATCTSTGLTKGEYCEDCDTTLVEQEETNMLDHLDDNSDNACDDCGATMCDHANIQSEVVGATCTEDGYTQYTCECGYNYKDEFVNKLGHTAGPEVEEYRQEATCTTAGSYDNVVYCIVDTCKAELSRDHIIIEATGHSETEFTYQVNASDSTKHDKKCADCDTVVATEAHVDSDSNSTCDLCNTAIVAVKTWQKATSIAVGDTITFVCESKKMELSGGMDSNTKYGTGVAYTTSPVGAYTLTVVAGSTSGTYAFKTSGGQYLYWTSGNYLQTNGTLSANTSWTVTFSNGDAIIKNAKDSARQIQWNATSPRFSAYTSAQTAIQIYVLK